MLRSRNAIASHDAQNAFDALCMFLEKFTGDVTVLAVGSVAHSSGAELCTGSDLDSVVVVPDSDTFVRLLHHVDQELVCPIVVETGLMNFRTSLNQRLNSIIFIRHDRFVDICSYRLGSISVIRNEVPGETHELAALDGTRFGVPRTKFPVAGVPGWFHSDWPLRVQHATLVHGSIINKLINNPVVVSRGRPDIYAEILARLDHLYREVARVYIASGGDGAGFVNLCIRSQKFGPETVEFLRCRVFQNPDTIATHILARLRGSEPVAYAYQQVKSRFRSQRIMNLADALQAHKFKCGVYPLANKLAACAELHYAASICVDDIIDGDETRHGKTTAWVRFGVGRTVMAAMVMFSQVQEEARRVEQNQQLISGFFKDHLRLLGTVIMEMAAARGEPVDVVRLSIEKTYTFVAFFSLFVELASRLYLYHVDIVQLRAFLESLGLCGQLVNDLKSFTHPQRRGNRIAELEMGYPTLIPEAMWEDDPALMVRHVRDQGGYIMKQAGTMLGGITNFAPLRRVLDDLLNDAETNLQMGTCSG